MVMPKAAKKAGEDADAAIAELENAQKETIDNTVALEDVVEDSSHTPVEAVVDGDGVVEPIPEPEVIVPEVVPPVVAGGVGDEKASDETYRQKYQTLMGKYNAEMPRLQAQVAIMQMQLEQKLAAEAAPVAEEPKGPAHARYLKPDELADYGEDILDMQARMAKGVAESVAETVSAPLIKRIDYLEAQLSNTTSSSFWERVEEKVPEARRLNSSDPQWFEFLEGVEDVSGLSFRELGERAIESGDVSRMVNLFQKYFTHTGASGSNAGSGESPVEKGSPPVKPAKTASQPVKTKAKVRPLLKASDMAQFYTDVTRGKYKGRDEARAARQKEIDSASFEGRVVAD